MRKQPDAQTRRRTVLASVRLRTAGEYILYGISTTRCSLGRPSPFAAPGSSAPSKRAATRRASISLRTRNNSCSFIRSTSYGFFIGESLACKFRLVLPVKEYTKPVSRAWEAATSSSGLGIKYLEKGADWPLSRYHKVNVPNDKDDS